MTESIKTTHIADLLSSFASAVSKGTFTPDALIDGMTAHFGGSDASGAWHWRMAYDLMEGAFIKSQLHGKARLASHDQLNALIEIAASLPTQTRRSEAQLRLQQFSTPLPYAFVAGAAAMMTAQDTVLEPSAGTGAMALMAKKACAKLLLNEIDPFRADILKSLFGTRPTDFDAEHIDDLMKDKDAPDVILMNPPFSSSVDRSRDRAMAAKHIISAAKRLNAGGRLVAIMPSGFNQRSQPAYWDRLSSLVCPRMALTLPGHVYRKMGTTVETQLLICDKIKDDASQVLRTRASDLATALDIVTREVPARRKVQSAPPKMNITPSIATSVGTAKRLQPAAPVRARSSATISPVDYRILDTPRANDPVSDVYARYRPQRIEITGARAHPTQLVESVAMASVVPPAPKTIPKLPEKLTIEGTLSEAQLEIIIAAGDMHARDLPGKFTLSDDHCTLTRDDEAEDARAYRAGMMLGDGTGCGKGRSVAGVMLANWFENRTRAIWVSKSSDLIEDAVRDWTDLGGSPTDIQPLSRWKPDQDITMQSGILFVTYATLRSAGKDGSTRLDQILSWANAGQEGDFEGVIAFDEAHAMQNAAGSTEGRGAKPSQQGLAGLRLQLALPRARVFYVSATGATQVHNLAYASRLGLWGQGHEYPFLTRQEFVASMEAGGVAAMEVVARDLKALGYYTARALSFDGIEYDILQHNLSADQRAIYDAYARAFKTIHNNLDKALQATGVVNAEGGTQSNASKASAKSRFESTKQRFFSHLLIGMKTPAVIAAMEADISDGWAPVVQIVSTGESLLKRRLETMGPEDALVEGALTPRDYVMGYLEQAFPIHAQRLVEVEGNMVAEPLRDENGQRVVSREALALREEAMTELMCLAPIASGLDQIIWHFGADAVAEVTGRSLRPVKAPDGQLYIEKRGAAANSAETTSFMAGDKSILIFSDAGGTGRSYHAAPTASNQKRRRHYLLEPGWRADAAIQGLGRTHRSAQVVAPWFRVCTTDVHGEKRFISAISRRLATLGAISKGMRETGTQGLFRAQDNLESPIARTALRALYADFASDCATSMTLQDFTDWTALKIVDKEGVMLEELPPIQRFLNRVLALPIHMQNALFDEFTHKIQIQTERARAAGTLDMGVETLRGERIVQVSSEDLWTCPETGSITKIIGLEIHEPANVLDAKSALDHYGFGRSPMINMVSGKVALIDRKPFQVYDDDTLEIMRKVIRPDRRHLIDEGKFSTSHWEPIAEQAFIRKWDAEADALPRMSITKPYLLTGLLLPIWKKIPSRNERIYRVTPEGGSAMIGRELDEDQVVQIRATFMSEAPSSNEDILKLVLGTSKAVDLDHGLKLSRRRVAGQYRLEIDGAGPELVKALRAMGCFTEIIQFQVRVFVPHGDGIDTLGILNKITGKDAPLPAVA